MAKLVSTTYADALFETGIEENTLDNLYDEALSVQQILKDNPDFSRLMNHPKILKEEKEQIMEDKKEIDLQLGNGMKTSRSKEDFEKKEEE